MAKKQFKQNNDKYKVNDVNQPVNKEDEQIDPEKRRNNIILFIFILVTTLIWGIMYWMFII